MGTVLFFSMYQFGLTLSLCLSLEKVGPCLCFLAGVTWHLSLAHDVAAVYASGKACQKGHRQDRVGREGRGAKAEGRNAEIVLDQV